MKHSNYSLPVETNRTYMKAIRELLGFGQYHVVRHMDDSRLIRESEVSAIEGKIGYAYLWPVYARFIRQAIEESDHQESVKKIMRDLLKIWEESPKELKEEITNMDDRTEEELAEEAEAIDDWDNMTPEDQQEYLLWKEKEAKKRHDAYYKN